MASTGNRKGRTTSGNRSLHASQSLSQSNSRPFLNMINPMGRTYQGYTQANQSLVEEEDEERPGDEDADLEAGRSTIFQDVGTSKFLARSQGKRKVSWDAGASEMNVLHPNIHKEDKIHERDSSDDEVPQSFMIEASTRPHASSKVAGKAKATDAEKTRRAQPLYFTPGRKVPHTLPTTADRSVPPAVSIPPRPSEVEDEDDRTPHYPSRPGASEAFSDPSRQHRRMRGLDEYEKALWNWVNVYNLDGFLQEVYYYYQGKGIYSIALSRGLNLLTVGFVIGFSTFLLGCIDYSKIRHDTTHLSNVIVGRCVSKFSGFTLLFFLLFTAFYVWQIISFVLGVMRLVDMYKFYTYLLKVPDADIQTISWPEIVRRIGAIREENPITAISSGSSRKTNDTTSAKLDAHDIANRILRQENYLIALFNKELLDLRVPLPTILRRFVAEEKGKGKMLTQALEWNLRFCLMEYLFDEHGRVRKVFLKSKNRAALIEGLRRRFIFMGILNAIFAPFIVLYLLMYSFFRYFEEYHKDPSSIGGRRYTSFSQWKFREFNELPHFFTRRLDESYPLASMFMGQFPNEKMTLIMRFVAFIAGSFAAVLVLATVVDPDVLFHFEITPHRTVGFYLGVFGTVLAVARGSIPDDNRVFDPELLMTEVITYTHYMPDEWKGQLHSKTIHQEFGELFAMKIVIFAQELLSVVLTPFVLWFSLPGCAPAIIDFFREFSVHVDGRGYVCSFAEFNFERHGNVKFGAPTQTTDQKMISNEGKMEKSFLNFKATNPDWTPSDPSGSLYLTRMAEFNNTHLQYTLRRRHARHTDAATSGAAVHFASSPPQSNIQLDASSLTDRGSSVGDKAQVYDRALRQSQLAAASRRRGGGMGGSVLGMSMLAAAPGGAAGLSASSMMGQLAGAQTVVLGDSQGSLEKLGEQTPRPAFVDRSGVGVVGGSGELDGEDVGSGLGESYVDGTARRPGAYLEDEPEEEDGLEDGGVLGLLAQIYGRKDGPAVM